MGDKKSVLIVNNLSLPIDASSDEAFSLCGKRLASVNALPRDAIFKIHKRSVDARKKDEIRFVYSVAVSAEFGKIPLAALQKIHASFDESQAPTVVFGNEPLTAPPVIVGSGPAGLFAALMLAENGYNPIILERGSAVSERIRRVEAFEKTRILDTDTNIQFGAGGAGTFSDGKLITRINDGYCSYVLDKFVEFGAPEQIRYLAKPHIGTDILCTVVDNMLSRIEALGGSVRYNTTFLGADFGRSTLRTVKTTNGDISAGALILAIGHSARDTYSELLKSGIAVEAKNFSVGMRIEHLADDIDKAMYGNFAGNELLGHAEYALSHNTKVRGVYTFCMCPGGEVVAAASENGGLVVNGMSRHSRNGKNSNSAVVCSVFKEDYGASPHNAIEFQRQIETAAFAAGGGDYTAPCITFADFLSGKIAREPRRIVPTYMHNSVKLALPHEYLPAFVCDSIKNAVLAFDKKISGFACADAVLTGAETRTSAPIRILRDNDTHLALGYTNLYPAGEGAGYAGGISSASIDGIKVALSLMKKFRPVSLG